MISFKGEIKDINKTFKSEYILTITTDERNLSIDELNNLKNTNKGLKIDISRWRDKRSLNANAYAWVLMDKIAEIQRTTKEEIYKHVILKVGVFEILPITDIAVESFIKRWQSKGLGWVCEIMGSSKIKDYTNVIAYYGTSTYNSQEMSRFIDEIVFEAQQLKIQTETPERINEMKSLWSEYEKQNK